MSTMKSQDEIRNTVVSLGLPEHPYFMRRAARAMDLLDTGKVNFVGDEIFRVHSQFDDQIYHVELNHGLPPRCDCADYQKNPGVSCKHIISSLLYARKQSQAITIVKTTDGNESDFWRRSWLIKQGNRRTVVYEEHDGRLFCNCGAFYGDCEHKQLVIKMVTNELKAIAKEKPVVNECGSEHAKALQDKMNGQLDSHGNNGNGATGGFVTADNHQQAPSQIQLDISDPFQQSEQLDIDQIEGRSNGELVHKLSNGEYVISYKGIMTLSEKHHITFEALTHDDTHTVIAKGRRNGSERVSGKPMNGCADTAIELAKRNAARQLLPYAELKAVEKKAQLKAESARSLPLEMTFDWQMAYEKCAQVAGGKPQVDITINELVESGRLRKDNPSGYDRTEYLILWNAIQDTDNDDSNNDDNNDGGDNTPSSTPSTVDIPPANETRKPVGESGCGKTKSSVVSCRKPSGVGELTTAFIGVGELTDGEVVSVDEIHCAICSRQLTNPTSRRLQIGPECRKKLGITGLSYLQDDNVVSAELMEASKLYHKEQFQKWLIRACFTLDAPIPTKVLNWLGNEWFGYRKAPILYYLSADGQLNRIDTFKRKLRHKIITKETAETEFLVVSTPMPKVLSKQQKELDSHAVRIASETNGNGNGNGGRKLQMDRKLRTWLIEAREESGALPCLEGTKKEISCREIAEQYDSSQKGIIKRLRAGIDSGADFSTVELN